MASKGELRVQGAQRKEMARLGEAHVRAVSLARFPEENPDPVLRLSSDLRVVYANRSALASFEKLRLRVGAHAPQQLAEVGRCALSGNAILRTKIACGGHIYAIAARPTSIDVSLYCQDVTEFHHAEQALLESEERFRILADSSPLIMWVTDAHGGIRFVNRTCREFFGVTFEKLDGGKWPVVVHPDDAPGYVEQFSSSVRGHRTFTAEVRVRRADGEWRWVATRAEPRFSSDGEFLGHVGISPDITERKLAEEASRASEERLRVAQAAGRIGAFEWNLLTGVNTWTPELEEMYGLPVGSFGKTQRSWEELLHPEDRAEAVARVEHAFETGEPEEAEFRIVWPDQTVRCLMGRWQVFKDALGKPLRLTGVNIDITEQKQARESLRESEEKYRGLFNSMGEACNLLELVYVDGAPVDVVYLDVNPAWEGMTGRKRKEVLGRRSTEVFGPIETYWLETMERVLRTGEMVQMENYGVSRDRWFRITYWKYSENVCAGTWTDITERKQAEKLLAADLAALTRLHELSASPPLGADIDELLQRIMDAAVEIVGATKGTFQLLEGDALRIVAHHGHEQPFLEFFASAENRASACGEALRRGERVVVPDIEDSPIFTCNPSLPVLRQAGVRAVQSTPVLGLSGRVLGVLTTQWGVTHTPNEHDLWRIDLLARQAGDMVEHANAVAALKRSEARLQALMDAVPVGIGFSDDATCARATGNPAMLALFEARSEDNLSASAPSTATGKRVRYFSKGREVSPDELPLQMAVARNEVIAPMEFDIKLPGGRRWSADISGAPIRDSSGEVIGGIAVTVDVTERKRAEEVLRDSDRRKGEFLAVLSHELRNPLAPIRNSVYTLQKAPAGGAEATRAIQVIDRQSAHLARLVDDLLDINRISRGKIELQRERIELSELVFRTVEDHRPHLGDKEISIEVDVAHSPIWVLADSTRLVQTIGNLLTNARKFTPQGGQVRVSVTVEDDQGVVRVRDTGEGIATDLLESIFDPFTQARQNLARSQGGLGLGLALAKGFVEMHGGSISAKSVGLGKGTEVVVKLPLLERTLLDDKAAVCAEAARPRQILVIEDNRDAAESLRDVLALMGHEVRVAFDGATGLAEFRKLRPEVLLCDLGLPDIDGYAVARALRADPEQDSCLLIALSGYAQPEDVAKAKQAGFDSHLAKPPTLEKLRALLA